MSEDLITSGGGLGKKGKLASKTQLAVGTGQLISGFLGRKEAERMLPGNVDPILQTQMNRIDKKIRGFETGTRTNRIASMIAGETKPGAFAGSGRAYQSAVNNSNTALGRVLTSLNDRNNQMIANLEGMRRGVAEKMSDRNLQLGMYRHLAKKAIAEKRIQTGGNTLMSYIANKSNVGADPRSAYGTEAYQNDKRVVVTQEGDNNQKDGQ
jgi:hypothetical protein